MANRLKSVELFLAAGLLTISAQGAVATETIDAEFLDTEPTSAELIMDGGESREGGEVGEGGEAKPLNGWHCHRFSR